MLGKEVVWCWSNSCAFGVVIGFIRITGCFFQVSADTIYVHRGLGFALAIHRLTCPGPFLG